MSVTTLDCFLQREAIRRDLTQLHSVLDVPHDGVSAMGIVHLSSRNFLLTENRSGPDFFIGQTDIHQFLLGRSFDIMRQHLRQDMCDLRLPGSLAADLSREAVDKHIPPPVQYACRFWVEHLVALGKTQHSLAELRDCGEAHCFLLEKLIYWLEALCLMGLSSAASHAIYHLSSLVDVRTQNMLVPHALRFCTVRR